MKTIVSELSPYWKIVYWFFAYPQRETTLNTLAKETKVSKQYVLKNIQLLIKEGIVTKGTIGKSWRLQAQQNHHLQPYKFPAHLSLLYETGVVTRIQKKYPQAKAIILFGSYRKGDDTEKSDVDIALELPGTQPFKIEEYEKITLGYRTHVPINLHIFTRTKIPLTLFNNIANGFVLEGFLEVAP